MPAITFKKKILGEWSRDDGELKKTVNEEAMFREIAKLMIDGWLVVKTEGISHLQLISIEKK
jgi:hypothetical protein